MITKFCAYFERHGTKNIHFFRSEFDAMKFISDMKNTCDIDAKYYINNELKKPKESFSVKWKELDKMHTANFSDKKSFNAFLWKLKNHILGVTEIYTAENVRVYEYTRPKKKAKISTLELFKNYGSD
jgi:hypothetical protein